MLCEMHVHMERYNIIIDHYLLLIPLLYVLLISISKHLKEKTILSWYFKKTNLKKVLNSKHLKYPIAYGGFDKENCLSRGGHKDMF